jgi:hypothetical protein
MNILNFNEADLEANRAGHLTERQQKRLEPTVSKLQQERKSLRWFMAIGLVVIVVVALIIAFSNAPYGHMTPQLQANLTAVVRVVLVSIIVMGLVDLRGWARLRELMHPTIHMIEGAADVTSAFTTAQGIKNSYWAKRTPLNRVQVHQPGYGPFAFHFVDKASLRYFKQGCRYRFYYLLIGDPYLLSAEESQPETPENTERDNVVHEGDSV